MKSFVKHLPHYLSLLGIILASVIGLAAFSYDKRFQTAIIFAFGASYISWGIVHHYLHKDLSLEVVFEYTAISILGIVLILSLILQ